MWAQCYVHKSLKHTQVKTEKLTTNMCSRAHLKSSQRYAHCRGRVEQADCAKHALAGSERVSRLLGPLKCSKSCFFGQRLWLRAFSHQTFTMSLMIQMDCSYTEKNTVSGIRLKAKISGQISLGACEAARSLEALPPRLRRF